MVIFSHDTVLLLIGSWHLGEVFWCKDFVLQWKEDHMKHVGILLLSGIFLKMVEHRRFIWYHCVREKGRVFFDSVVLKNIRNRDELCESIIRFINAWTVSKWEFSDHLRNMWNVTLLILKIKMGSMNGGKVKSCWIS